MNSRQRSQRGPGLPDSLLQQITETEGSHKHPRVFKKQAFTRREARKQGRTEKKQRKASFYSAPTQHPKASTGKRSAESEHVESPKRKKAKLDSFPKAGPIYGIFIDKEPSSSRQDKEYRSLPSDVKVVNEIKKYKIKTLKIPTIRQTIPKSRAEEDEENYIAYLEQKLGYARKGTAKGKAIGDGLDDLLDFTSTISYAQPLEDSFEEDDEDDDSTLEGEDEDDEDESVEYDGEWRGIRSNADSDDSTEDSHESEEPAEVSDKVEEAPQRGSAGPYLPPHLRNASKDEPAESEEQQRLKRKLNGFLNRMSEQNLESMLDSIEEVYRSHRRHEVTSILTSLIIEGTSLHSSLLDSFIVVRAALVTCLHRVIGIEFAAHFVQILVKSYEQYYSKLFMGGENEDKDAALDENKGKECSNLIVLLSELYNFQVVSCVLIFDIVRSLLVDILTEYTVELLLKLIRSSGQQLRQDDPSALKDIIQIVQGKISDQDDKLSSRTKFMVETLINLKNNKLKRNATQNQGGDAVERMKKFLTALDKKRHVAAHEPLRVSLDDLHSAESKGKWWLVGAAWAGDPLVERQQQNSKTASDSVADLSSENALIRLARKQGMNTDIRRSVFVVLLSSEDYVDACERLSQLNLSDIQQREILRVILHCCGNEKTYNPYYTIVGQHLCLNVRAHQVTLQYCLWDFLRELGEAKVGGIEVIKDLGDDSPDFNVKTSPTRIKNLARAYAWWLAKGSLALSILKPVDFTTLKQDARSFLRELFLQLFISSQVISPVATPPWKTLYASKNRKVIEEIFIKVTKLEALSMGLLYFLSDTFKNADGEAEKGKNEMIQWACGIAKDTLRTSIDVNL